jgi:hypothetical protein
MLSESVPTTLDQTRHTLSCPFALGSKIINKMLLVGSCNGDGLVKLWNGNVVEGLIDTSSGCKGPHVIVFLDVLQDRVNKFVGQLRSVSGGIFDMFSCRVGILWRCAALSVLLLSITKQDLRWHIRHGCLLFF